MILVTGLAVLDDGPLVRCELLLPGCSQDRALQAFTDPDLLRSWWHGELTTDLVAGGPYTVWFAPVPARMTGRVVRYEPPRVLEFSWAWEHEPDRPERRVTVEAATAADGAAVLTVAHGPHADDEEGRKARAEHHEGWEYFLPKLAAAV
jgi:uncharacterized protein YndB with AHSA1/START domain